MVTSFVFYMIKTYEMYMRDDRLDLGREFKVN